MYFSRKIMLTVIVPVYNESRILNSNIIKLHTFLNKTYSDFVIVIADSFSTDETEEIGRALSRKLLHVIYFKSAQIGKGHQIKSAIAKFRSEYMAFIDADLPISFDAFSNILNGVTSEKYDLVVGSRYISTTVSKRRKTRVFSSTIFNFLVKKMLSLNITDTLTGAKAWNSRIVDNVWPLVMDRTWFFDVELLYYALKKGYRFCEVPVIYTDVRKDSKLSLFKDGARIGFKLIKFYLTK